MFQARYYVQISLWAVKTFLVQPMKGFIIITMFEISYLKHMYDPNTGLLN